MFFLSSPLLVGSYVNMMLYTMECVCLWRYYSHSRHKTDGFLLKTMVYFVFTVDTLGTLAACSAVYLVCNSLYCNPPNFTK
jgi:hypothetical protein